METRPMTGVLMLALVGLIGCGPDEAASPTSTAPAASLENPTGATEVGAVRPDDRAFREWFGSCDNGNDCAAYTGSDNGGWLMVRQAAGPQARPDILIGMSAFAGADTVDGLRLNIDGESVALAAGPQGTMSYAVSPKDVPAVLNRLASARTIQVGIDATQVSLPTAGASAAFLWIDEKQGRLDTTTALMRRGSGVASSVPDAPPLPRAVAAPAVDQGELAGATDPGEQGGEAGIALPAGIEALSDVRACRADTDYNAYLQKAVLAGKLSADTELWGVPCGSGAYNAMYDFYVSGPDGASPRKVDFPGWEPRERTEGDIMGDGLVNPVFDPRANTISHFPRARGLGDCGTIQSWAWTGQVFVLTREASMGNCWGMVSDLWPTTWRTR